MAALEIFKAHDKNQIQGGFGHISQKVLDSWEEDSSLFTGDLVAAHGRIVKSFQKVKDFAGTEVAVMRPGDVFFKRIAFVHTHAVGIELRNFSDQMGASAGARIWVEEFISNHNVMVDNGFTHVCSKIRGDSTMMGVFCTDDKEPTVSVTTQADQVTLEPLQMQVPEPLIMALTGAMRREGMEWADHYSHYNVDHTWSALTLRGYGGREDFIIKPSEMSKKWREENEEKMSWPIGDTPARPRLREVEPLVDLVPGRKHRVRLMRLKAKSELLRHADITDPDAGTLDGQLLRIHIPVDTNPRCFVSQWTLDGKKKTHHMGVGEVWYLDTRKPHAVRNGGETDRIHLVMDVESNRDLRALLGIEEQETVETWL